MHMPTPPERRPTIVVVEDEGAIRGVLASMLKNTLGFEVVGETGDGEDAVRLILERKPELVLLDARLPSLSGAEVLRRVRRGHPGSKVLVFTGAESASVVRELVRAGASGIVEKSADIGDLHRGLEVVGKGGTYFSPKITDVLRRAFDEPGGDVPAETVLSPRELEVLKLIASSHTTKEIASALGIRTKTADNHRTKLMRKLNLHDVAALTRYAIRRGLVDLV